jgi:hypothetical protein
MTFSREGNSSFRSCLTSRSLHHAAREAGADDVLLKSDLVSLLLERLSATRVHA